jgi:uncharacterized membrane protein
MNKARIFSILIILMSFGIALYFYPFLPDQIASHWNASGEVNGYMSKFWGIFFLPILLVAINIILFTVPKIDPKKENIKKFEGDYESFIIIFNLFMVYVYFLTMAWNMGKEFEMTTAMLPAFSMFLFFTGHLLGKAKMNYTIGIKLPWTLSNEDNWNKTNKKGEYVFKMIGITTLLGVFFGEYFLLFLFGPLIIGLTYLIVYSYLEYRNSSK